MKILWTVVLLLVAGRCLAIENRDLYDVVVQGSVTLPKGNEESVQVNLQQPINFYTEKYDSIHVSYSHGNLHTRSNFGIRMCSQYVAQRVLATEAYQ